MQAELDSVSPGRTIGVSLKREGWHGRASFAWARTDCFSEITSNYRNFLHREELRHFESLRVEKRKCSFLLGRYTAKKAIRNYLNPGVADTELQVVSGIFNQPVVRPGFPDPVGVSISHSDRFACSLAYPETHPMAVDVEEIDVSRIDTMKTQILDEELGLALPHCKDESLACTLIWTAKEALSKVLRCGMTCPFQLLAICDFKLEPRGFTGRFKNFGQYKFQSWQRETTVVSFVLPRRTAIEANLPDPL